MNSLLYGSLNLKVNLRDIMNILQTSFSGSVLHVTDSRFFPLNRTKFGHNFYLQYGPRTRLQEVCKADNENITSLTETFF